MAPPNLSRSMLLLFHEMITSEALTISRMTDAASRTKRAIIRIRSNL